MEDVFSHIDLQRIAEGDEQAFRRLFHEFADNIYGVAVVMTRSPVLAEDMVQEIFLKVWLKREKLLHVENLRNYIFIIARNHILNELRSSPLYDELHRFFGDAAPTPEQELIAKESQQLLAAAVASLPAQQQAVFRLSRESGLSYEEIGQRLHIARNTVRNHMAQALYNIRQYLEANAGSGLLLFLTMLETLH